MAKHWLETLGSPEDVSVVPGNHDAYVPGAFDKVCRSWAAWMSGDGVTAPIDRNAFPYLRVRGNVALIGVSTARATAPFMANGFFLEGQAQRLASVLDATAKRGLLRVIMIHHPPVRGAVTQQKRLFGISRFHKTVHRHGAELVLHGHSHLPSLFFIGGRGTRIPVVGVAAAGQSPGGKNPAAQYNLLDIDGEKGNWRIRLTRRGLTGPAIPPSDLQVVELGVGCRGLEIADQKLIFIAIRRSQNSAAATARPTSAPAATRPRPDRKVDQRLPGAAACKGGSASRTVARFRPATAGSTPPSIMRWRSTMRSAT